MSEESSTPAAVATADRPRPSGTRPRLAWTLAGISIALTITWATSVVLLDELSDEPHVVAMAVLSAIGFAAVGAMIAARTGNAVGWCMVGVATAFGGFVVGGAYATFALDVAGRDLPGVPLAAWIATVSFMLTLMLVGAVPILFPTGRPRWPWLWHAFRAACVVTLAGFAILPGRLNTFTESGPENPFAIASWRPIVGVILGFSGPAIVVCSIIGIVSIVARYRRSNAEERQQIRWFMYVGIGALPLLVLTFAVEAIVGRNPTGTASVLLDVTSLSFFTFLLIGMPVAIGIAILKYRLFELDVVLRKTIVGGAMAVFITVVYAVIVGAGSLLFDSNALAFVAAAALAVAFQPVLQRARHLADVLVYGRRATPYEVLSEFGERVGAGYAADDVLERMAELLAAGTGAETATVWLDVGGRMVPEASWPASEHRRRDAIPPDAVEVRDRGEILGALSVRMPASDPLDPARERLIHDLAAQAGLVLRNARLVEELRASRQRLVAAQDEERRKIERNIHDGAQQQLVALSVKLRLLEQLAARDAEKTAAMARQLQGEAAQALDDLRDLARGIYPPLLADRGLVEALEAQARRSPVDVAIEGEGIARYPQDAESTVYFCCLEALQNVAKYAQATRVVVRLSAADGVLRFEVSDDGRGFDAGNAPRGSGLQGMADRLDAIGGTLEVSSRVGEGTTVTGSVPATALQDAATA